MKNRNRTKIVATLGPASRSQRTIEDLILRGVDVFRINAAHADHETMSQDIRAIRKVARKVKRPVGILVDLQGPKIRVGTFEDADPIFLRRGERLTIVCDRTFLGRAGNEDEQTRIGCRYEGLADDVNPKERILLDDGNIELRVVSIEGREIEVRVVYGGLLKQHKGINLPGSEVSMESMSKKDKSDLQTVLAEDVDYVALSFVRTADDIERLRKRIKRAGSDAQIIAKVERPEAVKNLKEVLEASDGLMVARGDMGVELGPEAVPSIQKRIIREAIAARKPVITATQMLESMITNPRPTRAEASDVANAIYDGTSAVMLSAETASGKYPVRAVRIMARIIRSAEVDQFSTWSYMRRRDRNAQKYSVTGATVRAAAYAALLSEAKMIAVFTESGTTARLLGGERTPTRIVAFTPFERTVQRMALLWGVTPIRLARTRTAHEMTLEAERLMLDEGIAKKGDRVVLVVGAKRSRGTTNIMNIRVL